ncbi:MAG: hypothetical protein QXW14_00680 [Candidatus Nitrosocaldus sp.]
MKAVALLLIIIFCSYMLAVLSLEHGRSILYRVDEYTDRYWNGYEWVYILYPLQIGVAEATSVIINGCNNLSVDECNDGDVRNGGGGAVNRTAADMRVGDDNANREFRSFVKFPISSLHGKTLKSAELKLTIRQSILNGSTDNSAPFNNPGLGNTLVMHINDYGTLDASDFNTPSIGNDPGVLIQASTNPSSANVSISVLAAMQDDISNSRNFTTYMIRAANGSDGDNRGDRWHFYTRNSGTTNAPRIEYTLAFTRDVREQVKLGEHDLLNRYIASSRGIMIALHTSDLQIRGINTSRLLVDSQAIEDMLARYITTARIFYDSISTLDDHIRQVSLSLAVDGILNAIDNLAGYSSITRFVPSSVTISDSIARMLDISRSALDGSLIIDNIDMGFLLRLVDGIHVSELINSSISYTRLIVDSINAAVDASDAYVLFVRVLEDSLAVSDLANYLLNLTIRVLADGMIVIDEVSRLVESSRILDEPLLIMDDLSRVIDSMSRVLIEPISAVDILGSITIFQREIDTLISIEVIRATDGLSRSIDVVKGIEDVASVADYSPSLYIGFARFLNESISVDHTLARMLELTLQLVESSRIDDLLSMSYFVSIIENINALMSMVVESLQGGVAGDNANTGIGAGGGGAGGTVLVRSTFITVDLSSSNDTLLVEGFLMDREDVIPLNTSLSLTLIDASDAARAYRSSVEVVDGRYRSAIPIDELFSAIAPNSAEIRVKALVTFNGAEHDLQGIMYVYIQSSSESSELRLERGLVFEAPRFNLIPSSLLYSGERLAIIHLENDGENDIDSLRMVINEGKVLKVKVSRNWKVTVQDDGILLEGIDGHALKQGKRLMILMLKQGQLNYIVTTP